MVPEPAISILPRRAVDYRGRTLAGVSWLNLASGELRAAELGADRAMALVQRIGPAEVLVADGEATLAVSCWPTAKVSIDGTERVAVRASLGRVLALPEDQLTESQLAAKKELQAIYDAVKADEDFKKKDEAAKQPVADKDAADKALAEATVNNVNSLIQRVAGTSLAEIETPFRVRYRLVGTKLCELYGADPTGFYIDQLYTPGFRSHVLAAYRKTGDGWQTRINSDLRKMRKLGG